MYRVLNFTFSRKEEEEEKKKKEKQEKKERLLWNLQSNLLLLEVLLFFLELLPYTFFYKWKPIGIKFFDLKNESSWGIKMKPYDSAI